MKSKILYLIFSLGTFCLAIVIGIIIGYYLARPNPNIEVPDESIEKRVLLQKQSDLIDPESDCCLII